MSTKNAATGIDTVRIFDTTLRDGEQAARINLNVAEKLQIAKQLAAMGVDIIEAGFSAASPGDFECVRSIAREVTGSTITALARTKESDIKAAADSLKDAARSRIHVFIATSPIHMEYKLKMTKEQVMDAVKTSVPLARSLAGEVEFSAEDASRSDISFLIEIFKAAIAAGATTINIPDTVGYAVPEEFGAFVGNIIKGVGAGPEVIYSVHCHNDLGLAVANSLSAVKNGARQVEGAINGLGERGGNAALEEVVMAIKTRQDFYRCGVTLDTTKLVTTSRLVSRLTGVPVNPNKPIVGANAFAHESGIHQHGVLANRETYEIMRAEDVGAEAAVMVLGKHSGRHAFQDRLTQLGYTLEKDDLNNAFAAFKKLCDEKKEVSDGDIEALVVEIISTAPERRYTLGSYEIECGTAIIGGPTARVVLKTADDKEHCDAAVGNGPIDAAYIAMQRITNLNLILENFQIGATSHSSDSVGEAQVTVRHPGTGLAASGRGISTDTVRAAIMAYVSAVNNLYMVAAAKEVKINGN
ncbi:MAG: 2-isopropylmalate synthase [Planctomycetes bacterium]|nr:2-isopropylmalate synthase [Planctomycetota bacterium]